MCSNNDRAEFTRRCTTVRQLPQRLRSKTLVSPAGTFMQGKTKKKKKKKNRISGTDAITHHYHSRLMAGHARRR